MNMTNPQDVFQALMEPLQRAVAKEGYTVPTPIQQQAIPHLLQKRDILGCAQTGTGKTAAFTLPMLHELTRVNQPTAAGCPRVLIITPTRELAAQIGDSVKVYGRYLKISHTVIFGGVSQFSQVRALRNKVDVVVATPGRLLDLMQQGHVKLDKIEIFILDEADRMLDMGFIPAVRKMIAKLPKQRQSLFFSATMPPVVAELAKELLHNPVQITIEPEKPTVQRIVQKILFVDKENKDHLLADLILGKNIGKVLVFTRTKHGADKVVKKLQSAGVESSAIHGNKSQSVRTKALHSFKAGRIRALVATDIAARGIDVDGITHVVNYELPEEPETYVHRIGRTARAGCEGDAVSFCSARERNWLHSIEKMIRQSIPIETDHKYHSSTAQHARGAEAKPEPRGPQGAARKSGGNQAFGRKTPGAGKFAYDRPRSSGNSGGSYTSRSRQTSRPAFR